MIKKQLSILSLLVFLTFTAAWALEPVEFRVNDPMSRNTVQFRTSAPLEDIIGVTSQVTGVVSVDPEALKSSPVSDAFVVDLTSLETGIGLRDQHMREQYLELSKAAMKNRVHRARLVIRKRIEDRFGER